MFHIFFFLLNVFYSIILIGDFMEETFNMLTNLIKKYDKILIMTHKNPDFDGLGASIGLQYIISSFGKESYIVKNMKEKNEAFDKLEKYLNKVEYFKTIPKLKALEFDLDNTLIIIIDTHKQEMVEEPQLIDNGKNIIIIDHHIKSKNYIKNNIFIYINVNLSSSIEFVANYMKYLNKSIDAIAATFMLVGLEIDTNNYRLKTTDKTYETAAFLTKIGADNVLKQELLQVNIDAYIKRQKLIEKTFIVKENLAICVAYEGIYEAKDLAVLALDMLQFENVEASFAIGLLNQNMVGISARSLGNINVEKIMSCFGGGGHITEAACQIKTSNIEQVKNDLINIIGG